MPKAVFAGKAVVEAGEKEIHYGYEFTAQKDGTLVSDIPDELIDGEVKAGRVALLKKAKGGE